LLALEGYSLSRTLLRTLLSTLLRGGRVVVTTTTADAVDAVGSVAGGVIYARSKTTYVVIIPLNNLCATAVVGKASLDDELLVPLLAGTTIPVWQGTGDYIIVVIEGFHHSQEHVVLVRQPLAGRGRCF
jgi:hypothetical protein